MKKTAIEMPFFLYNKKFPLLVNCGGSSFISICGNLL
jgi:hypothetical protein